MEFLHMKTSKFNPVLWAGVAVLCVLGFSSCDQKPGGPGHHKRPNERKSEPHGKQHSEEMHKKYNFKSETHGKQHSEEAHPKHDFKSEPHDKKHAPSARAPQNQHQPHEKQSY
ncbi:hypothetical protein COB11_02690 [Candidatus Aerophobetes bacterium]|uniref:Uncharacterized protein n=1 Tax=Aerophobetes bacterium TaxID=2030807 RepID=A0A2A4YLN4_UNCAE|nr:MAG: hypothetical protein COB11_02690 [Candidatus Aerophobetes bacterium]